MKDNIKIPDLSPQQEVVRNPFSDDTRNRYLTTSFKYLHDRKFGLKSLERNNLGSVNSTLKKISQLDAQEFMNDSGLKYEIISSNVVRKDIKPSDISEDVEIASIRFSKGGRIWGHLYKDIFYIFGFDPNHDVNPHRKTRR